MTGCSEIPWDEVVEAGRIMDEAAIPDEQVIYVGNGLVITERPESLVAYRDQQDPFDWESLR